MKTKEEFKEFIKKNPSFASSVKDGVTSWQELFELYSLYDEDSNVWDKYKIKEEAVKDTVSSLSLSSIIETLKGINLDSFQNNLESIQKAVSFLEEFTKKDDKKEEKNKNYKDEDIDRFYSD